MPSSPWLAAGERAPWDASVPAPAARPSKATVGRAASLVAWAPLPVLLVVAVALALRPAHAPWGTKQRIAVSALWRDTARRTPDALAPAAIGAAIAAIGEPLLRLLPMEAGGMQVLVRHDATADAWSLPDGTVVITDAMLSLLRSEAQLAALVAHVRAHASLGHVEATARAEDALWQKAADGLARHESADALAFAAVDARAIRSLDEERAADAAAVQALQLTGWNAHALAELLQLPVDAGWIARHPVDARRLEALAAFEQQRPARAPEGPGRTNAEAWAVRVLRRLSSPVPAEAAPGPAAGGSKGAIAPADAPVPAETAAGTVADPPPAAPAGTAAETAAGPPASVAGP